MEQNAASIEQRKIVKVKKRAGETLPEGAEDEGVVYSEDEFEEEIIHNRGKESDDEGWEDMNSDDDDD